MVKYQALPSPVKAPHLWNSDSAHWPGIIWMFQKMPHKKGLWLQQIYINKNWFLLSLIFFNCSIGKPCIELTYVHSFSISMFDYQMANCEVLILAICKDHPHLSIFDRHKARSNAGFCVGGTGLKAPVIRFTTEQNESEIPLSCQVIISNDV